MHLQDRLAGHPEALLMDRMVDLVPGAREPHAKALRRALLKQMVLGDSRAVLHHEVVDVGHDDLGCPHRFQLKGAEGTDHIEEQDLVGFQGGPADDLEGAFNHMTLDELAVTMSPITTLRGQGRRRRGTAERRSFRF